MALNARQEWERARDRRDLDRANLNPTPEAVAAMWLHSDAYSRQSGGSMDFYTARTEAQQKNCERLVADILAACRNHNRI